ncbi:AraC family transcriptional regulator [Yersinia entomophaga]|uniref:AraC family transcriptional regulator n=1 Tax=Yersinia entomophaga TaxID=935293 RepID=A0ABM6BN98_YERET|nr:MULTISPECIES: AraC family transcriptional regulator [Yersinia]ANI30955.1 AraC family transcriptional regulator [Yersinia entomophaga]
MSAMKKNSMRKVSASSKPIYPEQIVQQSNLVASDYRLSGGKSSVTDPVLFGDFQVLRLNPHLILHTANVTNLYDIKTQNCLAPSLKLAIVVSGSANISFGGKPLELHEKGPSSLISLVENTLFTRHGKKNGHERTLTLTFDREWLYGDLLPQEGGWEKLYDFTQQHLAIHLWQPSVQAISIAQQIASAPPYRTPLERLRCESQCIGLIIEAFSSLEQSSQQQNKISLRGLNRIQQLRDWLESGEADQLSLQELAQSINMSPSTLQRRFRENYNVTVFEYLRHCRLKRAMLALKKEGVSIDQAAAIAGYTSSANFATALRRTFNITPRQIREGFYP